MSIQREQIGMATPAELPKNNDISSLDWRTSVTALSDAKGVLSGLANPIARPCRALRWLLDKMREEKSDGEGSTVIRHPSEMTGRSIPRSK
jgi:hypothetical protein